MTSRDIYIKCAPKPIDYPPTAIEYINKCAQVLNEPKIHKYDFGIKISIIESPIIKKETETSVIRNSMYRMIPYILGMLASIAVMVVIYFPVGIILIFLTGAYVSKVALDLNHKLKIVNSAYFKASFVACLGLALETIILVIGRYL